MQSSIIFSSLYNSVTIYRISYYLSLFSSSLYPLKSSPRNTLSSCGIAYISPSNYWQNFSFFFNISQLYCACKFHSWTILTTLNFILIIPSVFFLGLVTPPSIYCPRKDILCLSWLAPLPLSLLHSQHSHFSSFHYVCKFVNSSRHIYHIRRSKLLTIRFCTDPCRISASIFLIRIKWNLCALHLGDTLVFSKHKFR